MRRHLLLCVPLALASCDSFPVPTDPRVHVSPYFTKYRVRGGLSMQDALAGAPADNKAQALGAMGQGHHSDDVGFRADIGDGFAGIRVDYFRLDVGPRGSTRLDDDLGSIPAGADAQAKAAMDEWRLSLTQEVYDMSVQWRHEPVDMQFAVGGAWANRNMDLDVRGSDANGSYTEDLDLGGDLFFGCAKMRLTRGNVSLDVEYALSPSLASGEWDGASQDFETRLCYAIPFQDVTVFAGWRHSTIQGDGAYRGLRYDADLVIDGYQFGVTVTF